MAFARSRSCGSSARASRWRCGPPRRRSANPRGDAVSEPGCSIPEAAPPRPVRVLLVAGEASGDLHGADLLRVLRTRLPALEVFGIGGERLREAGMETLADAGEVAAVGLAAGRLRALVRVYRALVSRIEDDPPDLCVLIDFPEF